MSEYRFNPLAIGPDHAKHCNSAAIIKLDESGEVFCPLCLSSSYKDIENIPSEHFEKYVRILFETLDQHGEKKIHRDIMLSVLEIILKKRDICTRSDHDFHNLLRIIYKIIHSEKFGINEFPAVTQMFSAITRRFTGNDPIPVISVSCFAEMIIDRAGKQLERCLDGNAHSLRSDVIKLFRSVCTTIRAYLELLGRFQIGRSSCSYFLLFPLHKNDDPLMHDSSYHKNNQIKCLDFAYKSLLPTTIRHLKSTGEPDSLDNTLVLALFEVLRECFISAARVGHTEFIDYVIREDCLWLAHTYCYKCTDCDLKQVIKSFIKAYVLHYVESKFEPDSNFTKFTALPDIVETNHKNAIAYSRDQDKSSRTIFYLMVNYAAHEHKSDYYNQDRLKKVISEVDPSLYSSFNSKAIIKVFLYAASIATRNVAAVDGIEKFLRKSWNRIRDGVSSNDFNEIYCSYEKVFFWAHQHPTFRKLITWHSIKRLVEIGFSQISIGHNVLKLLNDDLYKEHAMKYMENDESSVELIERLTRTIDGCGFHVRDRFHKPLMTKLGAIIPTLLYDALLKLKKNLDNTEYISKTNRLTRMILLWINHCPQLNLLLDSDFISAWFDVLDEITIRRLSQNKRFDDLLMLFIQFIISMIKSNHNQLIKILASLNYTSLSLMYNLLMNYKIGDTLAEKIASLIIAYDELDYPFQHDAVEGLLELNPNVLNWMLSENNDLHALSIRCTQKLFNQEFCATTRVILATGLFNMIAQNPEILRVREHANIIKSISKENEVAYNPLLSRMKDFVPTDLLADIDEAFANLVSPPSSPALSFDSDESDFFEEENISVIRILTQLQNEETLDADTSCVIPDALYVSRTLTDRHVDSVDTGDWERLASESYKNRGQSV